MTTKSDRNLSHAEAVAAGIINADYHMSDGVKWFNSTASVAPNPSAMVKLDKVKEHWEGNATISDEIAAKIKAHFPTKQALRFDEGKTNWSLMPFEAIEEINKVLEFGANKYAEWNFTNAGGMNHSRVINSLLRHIFSYMRGEDNDKESGLSHLAHAGCNIVFLLYYNKYPDMFKAKDDRHVR